ncbi:MAG: signal peptidase II [Phycisphaerae bacterium]
MSDATPPSPPSPILPYLSAPRAPRLAWRAPLAWLIFLLTATLGIYADLATKAYAFPNPVDPNSPINGLQPLEPAVIIPGVLEFITTVNRGAVFGMMQGKGYLFVPFSFVALAAVIMVFARSRSQQWVLHLALGLIVAGAIGNLYDRLMFQCVRDFLRFSVSWYRYIFNVADALLCIGVPLLMLCWVLEPTPKSSPATTEVKS